MNDDCEPMVAGALTVKSKDYHSDQKETSDHLEDCHSDQIETFTLKVV